VAPDVDAGAVTFALPDPEARLRSVTLRYHLRPPYPERAFHREDATWRLRLPRPPVARLEYLLELEDLDGGRATLPDPTNPERVPGVFGDQSVVRFPEYREPAWLSADAPAGHRQELALPAEGGAVLPATCWTSDPLGADEPAPMLLVHDGPEVDRFASLTRLLAAAVAAGDVPPCRALLLQPLDRNAWYSASPTYARSLADLALPAVRAALPVQGPLVAHGASLGALAVLHLAWTHPGLLGGMLLQSGSFFRLHHDAHEADRFARFWRVHDFVATVLAAPPGHPWPAVAMTVGTGEENLDNNRDLAAALRGQGAELSVLEVPDGHTWVGWRDALDPALLDLLRHCWR
jgi:enterochelin esterase family protein